MSGDSPNDRTIGRTLDYLGLAFILPSVEQFLIGRWIVAVACFVLGVICVSLGLNWTKIESGTRSGIRKIASGRSLAVVRGVLLLWMIGISVLGFLEFKMGYRGPSWLGGDRPAEKVVPAPKTQSGMEEANSQISARHDWHDKNEWRNNLRVGMTRDQVRRLFGEPEHINVSGNIEGWEYGSGRVTFADGKLYSWFEPS